MKTGKYQGGTRNENEALEIPAPKGGASDAQLWLHPGAVNQSEYMAKVCIFEGSGTYEVHVSGCGYEEAYLIDPRPYSYGEEMEGKFVIFDCTDSGNNLITFEDGVPYYFVLFYNRSPYSILTHLGVEEIEVEVWFSPA